MRWYCLLTFISALFILVMLLGERTLAAPTSSHNGKGKATMFWLAIILLLVVRLAFAGTMAGHGGDIQTFQGWAVKAAENFTGFYSGGFFADYPPGYMYALFIIGKVKELLHLTDSGTGFLILIKLPAILADLAMVALIYRLAGRRWGQRGALTLALMYGLNPAVIVDSAVWGQVDAVLTFFIALSILYLGRDKLITSVAFFTIALLIKPQALIFSPLFLAATGERFFQSPGKTVGQVLVSLSAGLGIFVAGILPFALNEGPWWIFRHYRTTLTSYPYASVNAFNLFALSGANFVPETTQWLVFTYKTWGTLFIILTTLFSLLIFRFCAREVRYYLMGLFLMAGVFIFAARMHERYLFPVLILLMLTAIRGEYRPMLRLFTGFSIASFINMAHVLLASSRGNHQILNYDPVLMTTAIFNLVLFACLVGYLVRSMVPVSGRVALQSD